MEVERWWSCRFRAGRVSGRFICAVKQNGAANDNCRNRSRCYARRAYACGDTNVRWRTQRNKNNKNDDRWRTTKMHKIEIVLLRRSIHNVFSSTRILSSRSSWLRRRSNQTVGENTRTFGTNETVRPFLPSGPSRAPLKIPSPSELRTVIDAERSNITVVVNCRPAFRPFNIRDAIT